MQSKQANELEAAAEGPSIEVVQPAAVCTSCDWALSAEAGAAVRYRSIFHQVAVGIVQTTVENRILEANPHLCAMLGYTAAELRNFTTRDLTHPDDRDTIADAVRGHVSACRSPGRSGLLDVI